MTPSYPDEKPAPDVENHISENIITTSHVAPAGSPDVDTSVQLTDQTNLLPFRKIVPVFLGLALCIVVSTLDSVVSATALPTISAAFNAGSVVSWVPSAYLLTSTSFQPLYGRFSDIFGRKTALCLAMGIFMIGSIASGFSRTITELIVFRGFAGAGGGGILSMAQIVMSDVVSLRERGKYQGIIGVVVAIGYAIGPLLGGALAERVSWRWCFWITPPMSLCAICVVTFVLPLKPVEGNIKRKLLAVDYVGTILTLVGCALLILPLIWGGVTFPWNSARILAPLLSGAFVVLLFCLWEWKGAKLPIVPMYMFKQITVTGVFITMFANGFVFFSSLYYIPQFFQVGLGDTPIRSGTFLLPFLVSQTFASFVAGVVVSRTGRYRTIIYLGFSIWAVGCGCLSTVTESTSKALIVFYMLLSGVGAGQTLQTTTVAAQASVSRKDMSVVTAVRNFIRLFGGTISMAVGSTIINNCLRSTMVVLDFPTSTISTIVDNPSILGTYTESQLATLGISPSAARFILTEGYNKGFRIVFVLNAAFTVVATLASAVMIKHKELIRGDEEQLRADSKRLFEKGADREDVERITSG